MKPEIIAIVTVMISIAAYIDWKEHRVPNWLNYSGMAFGLLYWLVLAGPAGLWFSFLGVLTGFACLVLPYLLRGMGAGDVKMMMAIGAWVGASVTFQGFLWAVIFGALMGMAIILRTHQVKERLLTVAIAGKNLISMRDMNYGNSENAPEKILLPYGVPIAFGFYALFIFGGLF